MVDIHCKKCGRVVSEADIMICEHCDVRDFVICQKACPKCCGRIDAPSDDEEVNISSE